MLRHKRTHAAQQSLTDMKVAQETAPSKPNFETVNPLNLDRRDSKKMDERIFETEPNDLLSPLEDESFDFLKTDFDPI